MGKIFHAISTEKLSDFFSSLYNLKDEKLSRSDLQSVIIHDNHFGNSGHRIKYFLQIFGQQIKNENLLKQKDLLFAIQWNSMCQSNGEGLKALLEFANTYGQNGEGLKALLEVEKLESEDDQKNEELVEENLSVLEAKLLRTAIYTDKLFNNKMNPAHLYNEKGDNSMRIVLNFLFGKKAKPDLQGGTTRFFNSSQESDDSESKEEQHGADFQTSPNSAEEREQPELASHSLS